MYSAPMSVAAASCTAAASGRVSFCTARPTAAPPATNTTPPAPTIARKPRRDGSSGPATARPWRRRDQATRTAISVITSPAAIPTRMLPSQVHNAVGRACEQHEEADGERETLHEDLSSQTVGAVRPRVVKFLRR